MDPDLGEHEQADISIGGDEIVAIEGDLSDAGADRIDALRRSPDIEAANATQISHRGGSAAGRETGLLMASAWIYLL